MRFQSALVTVIIPNWNGKHLLQTCLPALERQTWNDFEVIIVDNGSDDDSVAYIESMHSSMHVIKLDRNTGFATACNIGLRTSSAKYVTLLNNDTEPSEQWLEAMVRTIESGPANVGCLTSKMLQFHHPDLIDDAGDILSWRGGAFKRGHGQPAGKFKQQDEVMFPCAGAALYRRTILEKLEGFDEKFFMYLEDIDLGLRIRLLGYRCLFVPGAKITHIGHGSNVTRESYIFYTARNRIMVFLKNIPLALLLFKTPSLIYGWFFFWIAHRGHSLHLRGSLSIIKHLPHILNERRKIRILSQLSTIQIKHLITNEWPEVSLRKLLQNTLFASQKP